MTCKIPYPDGRLVDVTMTVREKPRIHAPMEPDVTRDPMASEWTEILMRLLRMDFDLVPLSTPAPTPAAQN